MAKESKGRGKKAPPSPKLPLDDVPPIEHTEARGNSSYAQDDAVPAVGVAEPPVVEPAPVKTRKPKTTIRKGVGGNDGLFNVAMHIGNLAAVFSSAIITPAAFVDNRAFPDPQTQAGERLYLTTPDDKPIQPDSVLLSIRLMRGERKRLVESGEGYLYPLPIPVSRIVQIRFADEQQREELATLFQIGQGGMLPAWMLETKETSNNLADESPQKDGDVGDALPDPRLALRRFDSIVGAYAFVRNYGLLTASDKLGASSLSDHAFHIGRAISAVPGFNELVNDSALKFYRQLFGLSTEHGTPEVTWISQRLQDRRALSDADTNEFASVVQRSEVSREFVQQAEKLLRLANNRLTLSSALQEIRQMKEAQRFYLYLMAFLRQYGNPHSKDAMSARKGILSHEFSDYNEYVFSCLGFFHGYKALSNYEDQLLQSSRRWLDAMGLSHRIPLKLDLETHLDLVIIESAFQVAFYGSCSFHDVDVLPASRFAAKQPPAPPPVPPFKLESKELLGKRVFTLRKEASPALPERVPALSELGLYCWRKGVDYKFIGIEDLLQNVREAIPFFVHFSAAGIEEALQNGKVERHEIERRLILLQSQDS